MKTFTGRFSHMTCLAVAVAVALATAGTATATAAVRRVPADYPTIQAAVDDASSGDTIRIAPGVYAEQVKIVSKNLVLLGQPGTILRATTNMIPFIANLGSVFAIVEVNKSDCTVRGLTFEGERLAGRLPEPGELKGLSLLNCNAVVENCAFHGFREGTPGSDFGTALTAAKIDGEPATVRVAGCTFTDSYLCMFLVGIPDRKNVDIVIENNVLIGPEPLSGETNPIGMEIREGVGGRISGNTISGFSYIGKSVPFPFAIGINAVYQAFGQTAAGIIQPLVIEGNTFRENQGHLGLVKANDCIVRNNRFQGTAPGVDPVGLALTGTNITVLNNQFENMPEGIRLFGFEPLPNSVPGIGDLLGYAINAHVISNRFCGVPKTVNIQSPSAATQTGTVLDACTSRPLVIAPAMLLSWPGDEEGWVIESAKTLDGPWAPSAATPFKQGGRNSVAVPVTQGGEFFRLR